jgi:hypothetical protein
MPDPSMKTSLAILAVVALIAIVTTLVVHATRHQAQIEAVWREFARKHGHRWVGPSGSWWTRKRALIAGEAAGVTFELDRYVISTGKSHATFTRVRTRTRGGPSTRVLVTQPGWFGRFQSMFQGPVVETGDREFDRRLLVRSKSQRVARELVLHEPVRKLALAFPRAARLDAKPGEVTLRWRNFESDPAVLAAAVDLATALASSAERA